MCCKQAHEQGTYARGDSTKNELVQIKALLWGPNRYIFIHKFGFSIETYLVNGGGKVS